METLFLGYVGLWLLALAVGELAVVRVLAASAKLAVAGRDEPVTLIKPVHGVDAHTEGCIRSWLTQEYSSDLQVVFSLQDPQDPALALLERLAADASLRPFEVIVNPIERGFHGKTSNLLHGVRRAQNPILVFSDADIEARPETLRVLVGQLQRGLDLCACLVVHDRPEGFWARAYALVWNLACVYLAGPTLVSGVLPMMPGGTVALRATTLADLGGVEAFGTCVIDDYALSRLAHARGKRGGLGPTVCSPVGPMDRARWLDKLSRGAASWRDLPGFPGTLLVFPLAYAYLVAIPAFLWAGNLRMVAAGCGLILGRALLGGLALRHSEGRPRLHWEHWVLDLSLLALVPQSLLRRRFTWNHVAYRRLASGGIEAVGEAAQGELFRPAGP